MSSLHLIELKSDRSAATVQDMLLRADARTSAQGLNNYISGALGGLYPSFLRFFAGAAQASGTLTLDTVIATNTALINGVTFTAVASGATGNQFNVGGSDTITAANLAAAINGSASALVNGHVLASAVGPVVTVTAKLAGVTGNAITIAGGGATVAASGARLTGGSNGTVKDIELGLAE